MLTAIFDEYNDVNNNSTAGSLAYASQTPDRRVIFPTKAASQKACLMLSNLNFIETLHPTPGQKQYRRWRD